jgi:hypothetical protein
MNSSPSTVNHLEALKLIKDWSSGLVVVQSAAIGVIGSLLKQPPSGLFLLLTACLLFSLIFSIWVGAVWVNGTIPYIVQQLPALLSRDPDLDIYQQTGGETDRKGNTRGLKLGEQCSLQSRFFVFSLVLLAVFIILLPPQSSSS